MGDRIGFERGKDIKESLRIGRSSEPIHVIAVSLESPYRGKEYAQHGYRLESIVAKKVLKHCEHSIPSIGTDLEENGYRIKLSISPSEKTPKIDAAREIFLDELKEEYILFDGELFKVLFPIQIEMNITINKDEYEF